MKTTINNTNNDITLYILMRTDLPSQGPGRAAAQASHATSVLEWEHSRHHDLRRWKSQTPYGYGTCIVLGATHEEITSVLASMTNSNFLTGWVIDPDYAIGISSELDKFIDYDKLKESFASIEKTDDPGRLVLHRREKTCAYILGNKEDLQPYLGHLPLYQG